MAEAPLRAVYKSAPRARWLLGVCLGALGRYGEADEVLAPAVRTDPLAATCRASHLRQLERHAEAEPLDRHALALAAPGSEGAADALIGLVADAVGRPDPGLAQERLGAATAALAGVAGLPRGVGSLPSAVDWGWRAGIRLSWVAAEVALLTDRAADALHHAKGAVRASTAAAAPRHLTKSLLFRGVAEHVSGDPGAARTLDEAARSAARLGLLPLVRPAREVRARVLASTHPEAARADAAEAAQVRQTLASWGVGRPDPAALAGEGFNFPHPNG
jgi:hypothetical protein